MGIFKLGGAIAKRRVVLFSVLLIIVGVGLLPQVLSADEDASNGGINAHNRPVIVFNGPAAGAVNADDGKTINAAITTVSSGHTIQNTRYKKIDDVDECSQTHTDLDTQTERQAMGQAYTSGTDVTFTENGKMLCIYAENRFGSGTGFYYSLRESNPVSGLDSDPPTLTLVDDSNLEIHEGAVFSKTLARFKFRSSETGSITGHTGACGAATSTSPGDASTNLPANTDVIVVYASLADGLYDTCEMTVEDDVGHEATLSIPSFTIDTVAPEDLAVAFTDVISGSVPLLAAQVGVYEDPFSTIFNAFSDLIGWCSQEYVGITANSCDSIGVDNAGDYVTPGTFTLNGETYTVLLLAINYVQNFSSDKYIRFEIVDSNGNAVNTKQVLAGYSLRFVGVGNVDGTNVDETLFVDDGTAAGDNDEQLFFIPSSTQFNNIYKLFTGPGDSTTLYTFTLSIGVGGADAAYLNSAGASNTNDLATVTSDDAAATYTYKVVQSSVTCDENVSYEATIPGGDDVPAAEGDYNLCVKAADAAENTAYAGAQFTKDITAPSSIGYTPIGALDEDDYINAEESDDAVDIVTGITSNDSSAVYAFAIVSDGTTCNSSVDYNLTTTPQADEVTGSDGRYKICIRATDPAGNSGYNEPGTFTKDTVFNTPTLTLALSGENRVSGTDYLNAGDTMTFTATVDEDVQESDTTIRLELDNNEGRHTFDMTKNGNVFTGVYTIASPDTKTDSSPEVRDGILTDLAGNTLEAFGALGTDTSGLNSNNEIRIDTTPPAQITITRLAEASDTCIDLDNNNTCDYPSFSSNSDTITSETTPDFDVDVNSIEAHATLVVTATPGVGSAVTVTKTHNVGATPGTSYDTDTLTTNGAAYDITMTQTDRAENTSPVSASGYVEIDTAPPPTTAMLDLNESSDSCVDLDGNDICEEGSNSDDYTNLTLLSFDISNIQGGTDDLYLMLRRGGNTPNIRVTNQTLARGPVSNSTATLIYDTATDSLGSVDQTFTAELFDKAGNSAVSTNNLTVYLDYSTPTPTLARGSGGSGEVIAEAEIDVRVLGSFRGYVRGQYGSITGGTFSKDGQTYTIDRLLYNNPFTFFEVHDSNNNAINIKNVFRGHTLVFTDQGGTQSFSVDDITDRGNGIFAITTSGSWPFLTGIFTWGNIFTFTIIPGPRETDTGASNTDGITYSTQYAFDLGDIEIEQTNRGNGAKVVMYDNSNAQNPDQGNTVPLIDEVGHDDEAVTTAAQTVVTTKSDYTDGKHDFRVCQTDDAGNVACNTGAVSWITDTAAPTAPLVPDLNNEDDSFGTNANGSRSGTNDDSITRSQYELDFASRASGTQISEVCIGSHCAHDQHQIRFYEWTDDGDNTVEDTELTQIAQPSGAGTDNVRGTTDIDDINDTGYTTYNGQRGTDRELYPVSDNNDNTTEELSEGIHHFVAKQYDIAGNLSPASESYELQVDITAPSSVTTTLVLHKLSDTGDSNQDKQTSNVTPAFRFAEGSATSSDIDYYEVRRARMTDEFTNPSDVTMYTYPSNPDIVQQTSYEYAQYDTGETTIEQTPEAAPTFGEGAYQNGALVRVASMEVPTFNSWYAFKVFAVDLAGNYTPGSDAESVRILVPPPTPSLTNLADASDSCADPDNDSTCDFGSTNTDNITNETTWTLSGSYQNTTTPEIDNNAAAGVRDVVIRIDRLDSNNQPTETLTHTFTTQQDGDSTNNITAPANVDTTGADDAYTYSFAFDATAFTTLSDGTYSITATALNDAGEEGITSAALSITLDRTAPVPGQYLKVRSQDYYNYVSGLGVTRVHGFSPTNPSSNEPNAGAVVQGADNASVKIAIGDNGHFYDNGQLITDFSYNIDYIDAAGNASGSAPLLEESKPPIVTSYVTNEADNKYIIIAAAREGAALANPPAETYDPQAGNNSCSPIVSKANQASFTLGTIQTISTETCVEVEDTNGNTTARRIQADKNELIANAEVHDEDDTGRDQNDNITNNTNPRYTATTLPGSTVRLQTRLEGETWTDTDVYEQTLSADSETGVLTAPNVRSASDTRAIGGGGDGETIFSESVTSGTGGTGNAYVGYSEFDTFGSTTGTTFVRDDSTYTIYQLYYADDEDQVSFRVKEGGSFAEAGNVLASHTLVLTGADGTVRRISVNEMDEGAQANHPLTLPVTDDTQNDTDFNNIFSSGTVFTLAIVAPPTEAIELRGYVTNPLLGASEVGPIALTEIIVDTVAPPNPAEPELVGSDDTGSPDRITANTTDLTITVRGESEAIAVVAGETGILNGGVVNIDIDLPEEGPHTLTATQEDIAGNTSAPSDPLTITIDTTAADITLLRLNDTDTTIDANTQFIAVASDSNPTLQTTGTYHVGDPQFALVDETAATCEARTAYPTGTPDLYPDAQDAGAFSPASTVTSYANGLCFIHKDKAGNISTKHTDSAIEGVGNLQITGGTKVGDTYHTRSGGREVTGVTASGAKVFIKIADSTDDPTTYTDEQRKNTGFANLVFDTGASETAFTETLSVSSGDTGKKLIGWIWTDNTDEATVTPAVTLGTLTVDNTKPQLTEGPTISAAADKPQQKQGDTITAVFRADEIIQTTDLTIAGQAATCTAIPTTSVTHLITCTVTLGQDSEEGRAAFKGTITDRAGNETTINKTSDIEVDARAPIVEIKKTGRELFAPGETIQLNLNLTDRNSIKEGTYTFTVSSTAAIDTCTIEVTGTTTKNEKTNCTVTIHTTATDGQEVTLTVPQTEDGAGNSNPTHTVSLGRIDTSAPTLSAITKTNDAQRKRFSFTIEAVHNQHTNNADLKETLTPVFSGDCSDFRTDTNWTSTTPADGQTQTYSTTISTKGTYDSCTLTLRDEAGNGSDTLTFEEISVRGGGGVGNIFSSIGRSISTFFSSPAEEVVSFQPQVLSEQQPQQTQGGYYFTENLTIGSIGEAVRQLQIFLNNSGYTVAQTGAGSPGNETAYFGELTRQALIRYQQANNITPASGYFGPITRAQVNGESIAGAPSTAGASGTPSTPSVPDTGNAQTIHIPIPAGITATYSLSDSHSDIRAAQILLNQTTCTVATTGAGSPGNETAYFGNLTENALKCFQGTQGLTQDGILTPALYQILLSVAQGGSSSSNNNDGDNGDNRDNGNNNNDGGDDDNYNPILQPTQIQRSVNTGAPAF